MFFRLLLYIILSKIFNNSGKKTIIMKGKKEEGTHTCDVTHYSVNQLEIKINYMFSQSKFLIFIQTDDKCNLNNFSYENGIPIDT